MRIGHRCNFDGCENAVYAKGVCRKHYDVLRKSSDTYRAAHTQRRTLRRMRVKGVRVDRVYRRVVWERDKGRCGICGGMVDFTKVSPDPMAPSLDHIVPISKGGEHSYTNIQLAHLGCNMSKGSKLVRPKYYQGARIVWIKPNHRHQKNK